MDKSPTIETHAQRLYTRSFFHVFVAAGLFVTGMALQFHFGQYVAYLGYDVDTLGTMVSLSMIGTLAIRLHIGRWIDRFGCRPVWLVGTVAVALSVGAIQFTESLWLITTLRMISTMATAAVMTTVAVFAALVAPPQRSAEAIGTIGLAGFAGMIIGPTLGDWIFADASESILPYRLFFSATALSALAAAGVILLAVLPDSVAPPRHDTPGAAAKSPSGTVRSQLRVVWRHWPGAVLLVSVSFALSFCLQNLYLERLAEERGFKNIELFFMVYCPIAIALRILFRRLPQQIGRCRTLVLGMVLMGIGQLCLLGIQSQGGLILPGLLMGAGHCFIFPSMVDLGADKLPKEYRGTGTALVLGAGDFGMLIGYQTLGQLIEKFGFDTALTFLAVTMLSTAVVFTLLRRKDMFAGRSPSPGG